MSTREISALRILVFALMLSALSPLQGFAQLSMSQWKTTCDRAKLDRVANKYLPASSGYKKALTLAESFGPESNQVQLTLLQLSEALVAGHQVMQAGPYCERELAIIKKQKAMHAKSSPEILVIMQQLADTFDREAALPVPTKIICLNYCVEFRLECEPDPSRIGDAYYNLGTFCLEEKAYAPCEGTLGQVALLERTRYFI